MKQSITLLFVALLLLMTGCAKGPEEVGAISGEALAGTEAASSERFKLPTSPEDNA